jgi:N-acetylglutamate synthase-like GNAT family acetyltransferase
MKSKREYMGADIPVRSGNVRMSYLRSTDDLKQLKKIIKEWKGKIGSKVAPKKDDALEFARLATERWKDQHAQKRTADSIERIKELKTDNPNVEVGILAVAYATWTHLRPVVGICGFRCTWPSNIAVDYLVVHPILEDMKPSPIDGLGAGIMQHVCAVANQINAKTLWGETTQNSVAFYRKILGIDDIDDLIVLKRKDYIEFITQLTALQTSRKTSP